MRGILYKGWFPFAIPQVAEDGLPFQQWDGSTQAQKSFSWLPSKSSSSYVTVYGANSLYCISMTLDQLIEWYWRVSQATAIFTATSYAGVSSTGQGGTASITGTYYGGTASLTWDLSQAGTFSEFQNILGTAFSGALQQNWSSGVVIGSGGYNTAQVSADINVQLPNGPGAVIYAAGSYWLNPGFNSADVVVTGYASNTKGTASLSNSWSWDKISKISSNYKLDPISLSIQLSNVTLTGNCYAIKSGGTPIYNVTGTGASVTYNSPGSWKVAIKASKFFTYGGVWDATTGLLTGN
jgi:hypothetical protein